MQSLEKPNLGFKPETSDVANGQVKPKPGSIQASQWALRFESPRLSGMRILRIRDASLSRDLTEPRTNHDGTSVEALAASSTEAASQ
eukprot:scaffold4924_cov21-Cyclotella_meneghiniana.AAC.3